MSVPDQWRLLAELFVSGFLLGQLLAEHILGLGDQLQGVFAVVVVFLEQEIAIALVHGVENGRGFARVDAFIPEFHDVGIGSTAVAGPRRLEPVDHGRSDPPHVTAGLQR